MSETTQAPPAEGEDRTELKRVMGPKLLLLFIVGDILGTGVYALTGDVAAEVGGAAWAPFIVAFAVAMITAFSYLELVTKYPQAAGVSGRPCMRTRRSGSTSSRSSSRSR